MTTKGIEGNSFDESKALISIRLKGMGCQRQDEARSTGFADNHQKKTMLSERGLVCKKTTLLRNSRNGVVPRVRWNQGQNVFCSRLEQRTDWKMNNAACPGKKKTSLEKKGRK